MKTALVLALFLLCADRLYSQTFVQQKDQEQITSVASFTLTPGSSVGSGNLLIVALRIGNTCAGSTSPSVSGSVNGSFTQVSGFPQCDATNGRQFTIFYKANSTSGAETITCSWTGASINDECEFFEYSGMAAASVEDQHSLDTCPENTATPNSGNITTTQAKELIFGMLTFSADETITVTTESTSFVTCSANGCLNDTEGTASHPHLHSTTRSVNSTGTYAYAPTMSGAPSAGICAGIVSFKARPNGFPVVY